MSRAGTSACDTSVLVPALVSWHPRHEDARRAISERSPAVPAHVLAECFAVLTRLPAPHRLAPEVASEALRGVALDVVSLPGPGYRSVVVEGAARGITGGAIYDAVVAATAKHHSLSLLSDDRRARATYDALGVPVEYL